MCSLGLTLGSIVNNILSLLLDLDSVSYLVTKSEPAKVILGADAIRQDLRIP
jgi:hypothetical protein